MVSQERSDRPMARVSSLVSSLVKALALAPDGALLNDTRLRGSDDRVDDAASFAKHATCRAKTTFIV